MKEGMRKPELEGYGRAIAAEMGPGWVLDAAYPEDWDDTAITGPAGAPGARAGHLPAALHLSGYDSRLTIEGRYPDTSTNAPEVKRHEISVEAAKPAGVIAKDITRRLFPGYLPELARVLEFNRKESRDNVARRQVMTQAAALFGKGPGDLGDDGRFKTHLGIYDLPGRVHAGAKDGTGSVSITATGDGAFISADLHDLPAETALAILALVAKAAGR